MQLPVRNDQGSFIDGRQLAAVCRIKPLWRLCCCALPVCGFGEGERPDRVNMTTRPTAQWIAQQIIEAFPWTETPSYTGSAVLRSGADYVPWASARCSCQSGKSGPVVNAARKRSPQALRSFSEIKRNRILCRARRSSSDIESACEREVATASGSSEAPPSNLPRLPQNATE